MQTLYFDPFILAGSLKTLPLFLISLQLQGYIFEPLLTKVSALGELPSTLS